MEVAGDESRTSRGSAPERGRKYGRERQVPDSPALILRRTQPLHPADIDINKNMKVPDPSYLFYLTDADVK